MDARVKLPEGDQMATGAIPYKIYECDENNHANATTQRLVHPK